MKGHYVTASRLASLERSLVSRERAIIEMLDSLRVATTEQVRRMHFADLTTASAARQAPRTMRRLSELRVVTLLERRIGGVRAGSAAAVWGLDLAGQKLASACGPAGGQTTRRPWTPGLAFIAHRLAITEVAVTLAEASRLRACEVLQFEAEPRSWRRFPVVAGGSAYLKPDAFARVAVGDYERGSFIEIDRATESTGTVARKLTAYRRYWEAGREQERRGYFPKVVIAVPTRSRKSALAEVCRRQPEDAWPLFRVVLARDLTGVLIAAEGA